MEKKTFRQKLAGFGEARTTSMAEQANMTDEAVRFSLILAQLFGPDLDRITLWSRIETALKTGVAKARLGDMDSFVAVALEVVQAETGRAAASEPLLRFIETLSHRDETWRGEFMKGISKKSVIIVVKARAKWEDVKAGRVTL